MRLIPSEISLNAPSSGEKRLHKLLKDIQLDNWVALHSVNLPEHEYKTCGEIDFMIISPSGILVLEVKSGGIQNRDGIWKTQDRWGETHRLRESPFDQAKTNTFSLMKRLRGKLPSELAKKIPFAWGVVIPDVSFQEASVEWVDAQVFDKQTVSTPNNLKQALLKLAKHAQESQNRSKGASYQLSTEQIKEILRVTRPDFEKIPLLSQKIEHFRELQTALTEEQYQYLDATEKNARIVCTGGAGTGKTFLAVEAARREASKGRTVNLICRSAVVSGFISHQQGMENELIHITPFNRLDHTTKTETLLVDEGQDVMNTNDLSILDNSLEGGLEKGRWMIFADHNNQAGVLGNYEDEAMEMIRGFADSNIHLTKNCRNTKEIISEVEKILPVEIGENNAGTGPTPETYWWEEPIEAAKRLEYHLKEIRDQSMDPRSVTILTGGPPHQDPVLKALNPSEFAKLSFLSETNVNSPPQGKIPVVNISLFKGLENDVIFVTGIASSSKNRISLIISNLYVSMTRPRAKLFMLLHSQLKPEYENLIKRIK